MEDKLEIIYEDSYVLAINKPSGLVVNRSITHKVGPTLQDLVESHLPEGHFIPLGEKLEQSMINNAAIDDSEIENVEEEVFSTPEDFTSKSGIIHRLDKDTSGVILVGKSYDVFIDIQKQFKNRKIKKEYRAVVYGRVSEDYFQIDAPLKRNPRNRMKYGVGLDGKSASTFFEKINEFTKGENRYSSLKVFPETGRTHQIRVHCAALNHPVASDPIYCTKNVYVKTLADFDRLMLHAFHITFKHPITREVMTLEAPLPAEFVV